MKRIKLVGKFNSKQEQHTVQASSYEELLKKAIEVFEITETSIKLTPINNQEKFKTHPEGKAVTILGKKQPKKEVKNEYTEIMKELKGVDQQRFKQALDPFFFAFVYDSKTSNYSAQIMMWLYITLKMPSVRNWMCRQKTQAETYGRWQELRPQKPKPIIKPKQKDVYEMMYRPNQNQEPVEEQYDENEDRLQRLERQKQFMTEYKFFMHNYFDRMDVISENPFSLEVAWQNYRGFMERPEPLKLHPREMIEQWYNMLNVFNLHPSRQADPVSKVFGICSEWGLINKAKVKNTAYKQSDFLHIFMANQAMFLQPFLKMDINSFNDDVSKILKATKITQTKKLYLYQYEQYELDLKFIRFSQYLPTYLFIYVNRYHKMPLSKDYVHLPKYLDVSSVCSEPIRQAAQKPEYALKQLIEKYNVQIEDILRRDKNDKRDRQERVMDALDSLVSERQYNEMYNNMHDGYYHEYGTMKYNLIGFVTNNGTTQSKDYGFVCEIERDKWVHLKGIEWKNISKVQALTSFNEIRENDAHLSEVAELLVYRKIYVDYRQ